MTLPASTTKYTEASVTVPVWVRQSSLDGICDLIAWCDGFRDAKGGTIPGIHELIMHYRTLTSCISSALKGEKTEQEEDI